jgi:hypothetical protein
MSNDLPRRKLTKQDIDFQKAMNDWRLRERIVESATVLVIAVFCVLALFPLRPIVALLAGKDTKISVGITVSLTFAFSAGTVGLRRHLRKDREQSRELERLRERLEDGDKDLLQ